MEVQCLLYREVTRKWNCMYSVVIQRVSYLVFIPLPVLLRSEPSFLGYCLMSMARQYAFDYLTHHWQSYTYKTLYSCQCVWYGLMVNIREH